MGRFSWDGGEAVSTSSEQPTKSRRFGNNRDTNHIATSNVHQLTNQRVANFGDHIFLVPEVIHSDVLGFECQNACVWDQHRQNRFGPEDRVLGSPGLLVGLHAMDKDYAIKHQLGLTFGCSRLVIHILQFRVGEVLHNPESRHS